MKKIDKLVIKLLELNPLKTRNATLSNRSLTYKNLKLTFWSMNEWRGALVRVNDDGDVYTISNETRLLVLDYFSKNETLDDIMKKLDKETRNKKLKKINA